MFGEVKLLVMEKFNNDPESIEKKVASTISTGLLMIAMMILISFFKAYII